MSSDHFACLSTGSTLSPISLTPRLSNSGFNLASAPSSVVQTGVKSFGCENNSAQLLPIQSWNLILPSVVSASKSGATAPIWSAIFDPLSFRLRLKLPGNGTVPAKEHMLLEVEGHVARCFNAPHCDVKITMSSKA